MAVRRQLRADACRAWWGLARALLLTQAACDPLIATVGVDTIPLDAAEDVALSSPLDTGTAPPTDAGERNDAEVGPGVEPGSGDAAVAEPLTAKNCITLPELLDLSAASQGTTRSVDNGIVWARFDKELGCANPANVITYGRVDGAPLVPQNATTYTLSWPASSGMGTASFTANSTECGEPLAFPFRFAVVVTGLAGCEARVPAARYLRVAINAPSPFPQGLELCENACPP